MDSEWRAGFFLTPRGRMRMRLEDHRIVVHPHKHPGRGGWAPTCGGWEMPEKMQRGCGAEPCGGDGTWHRWWHRRGSSAW